MEVIHYTEEDKRLYDLYHKLFKYDDGNLVRRIGVSGKMVVPVLLPDE